MATKTLTQPVTWKRITTTAALDAYVGAPGEPFIDFRDQANPALRIGDGETPGGHLVEGGGEAGSDTVSSPSIVSPIDGAASVASSPIVTADSFVGMLANGNPDTHAASVWRFATDAAMTSVVYTSGRTTADLTSIDLSGKHGFSGGQTIYADVEYEGGSGVKARSAVVSFTVQSISVGGTYEGDVVVGQLDGDYILAAPATMRTVRRWGLYGTDVSELPNDPNPNPNTGTYNTDVLTSASYNSINDGQGSIGAPAAEYARSQGYDLPNRQELQLIYDNLAAIDSADTSGRGATLAAIKAGTAPGSTTSYVWSSTEYSSNHARNLHFSNGSWNHNSKDYEHWVVPVRRISV